jgi:hypothetical protein
MLRYDPHVKASTTDCNYPALIGEPSAPNSPAIPRNSWCSACNPSSSPCGPLVARASSRIPYLVMEPRRVTGRLRCSRSRCYRHSLDDHQRQPLSAVAGIVRVARSRVDRACSFDGCCICNRASQGVQRSMSLLSTSGRTGKTTLLFSTFPPFLNCPAASMAAFWPGCFGHPQPHTPRSLNVVEISRCVNEDSLRRQGIWFWVGFFFFFLYRGTPGWKGEVVGLGGVLEFPPNPLPSIDFPHRTRMERGGVQS